MIYSLALLLATSITATPLPDTDKLCEDAYTGYNNVVTDQKKVRGLLESMAAFYKQGIADESALGEVMDLHAKISEQVGAYKSLTDSFCP